MAHLSALLFAIFSIVFAIANCQNEEAGRSRGLGAFASHPRSRVPPPYETPYYPRPQKNPPLDHNRSPPVYAPAIPYPRTGGRPDQLTFGSRLPASSGRLSPEIHEGRQGFYENARPAPGSNSRHGEMPITHIKKDPKTPKYHSDAY